MDTQWPRFQVFVQERDGDPYLDYGSVHAPDAELALFNARDVFARRPEAVGMWVVPVQTIYARTAEQLSAGVNQVSADAAAENTQQPTEQRYHVFCKPRPAGTHTQVGMVEAASPPQALARGLEAFSGRFSPTRPPEVWWVFPVAGVCTSGPEDIASLYAPAHEKGFRLSTDFHTHSVMRSLKDKQPTEGSEHG
jgi:ring-1,2-phenylacetyl-CoA epoxidase subunit PaaB